VLPGVEVEQIIETFGIGVDVNLTICVAVALVLSAPLTVRVTVN
jgi:hypothetical protein